MIENSKPGDDLFIAIGFTEGTALRNVGSYLEWYFTSERCATGCKYNNFTSYAIRTKTGIKNVIFVGGNTKTANSRWHGFTVSGIAIDEADRICQESIDEAFQRITTKAGAHIIATLNPNIVTHPFYKQLDNWISQGICLYSHFTLEDNPVMTPELIKKAKMRYAPGSAAFKRYFLGQRVNASDTLFEVNDYNILHDFNPKDYISYIIVCDPGESISATTMHCICLRYQPKKGNYAIDILKEYYHLNDKQTGFNVKMMPDYAHDLAVFKQECYNLFGKYSVAVIIDESIEFYRNVKIEFSKMGLGYQSVIKPIKEDDETRIRQISSLLYSGQLNIYEECKHCIQDLQVACMDPKAAERGEIKIFNDYTTDGHQDSLDDIAYGLAYYYDRFFKIVKQ